MDSKRLILYAALAFVSFMLWQAWEKEYGTPAQTAAAVTRQTQTPNGTVPILPSDAAKSTAQTVPATPASTDQTPTPASLIHVTTDVLNVNINPVGGDVVYASLPKYPADIHSPNTPFVLLDDKYMAQSRLFGTGGPDSETTGPTRYNSAQTQYNLGNNNDLRVDLTWQNNAGLSVVKSFLFKRGAYAVQVSYTIKNDTAMPWTGRMYTQLQQDDLSRNAQGGMFGMHTYTGAAYSTVDQHFKKVDFGKMAKQDLAAKSTGGWVAMLQHYFLSAWVPAAGQENQFYSRVYEGKHYVIGAASPTLDVAPKTSVSTAATLYVGPELPADLKKIAPYLDLTIDYGILWPISEAIFWVMSHLYNILGNWGFAIIFVTIIIKLAFYRLSAASYKSMARMRQMQPRIEALKERYGSDRQKMGQAMMELYRKEKINPLGGCLPVLVQIPFFIALYWVLMESVELRQSPFIGWIQDLSVKDPYLVLPILMGLTMIIQQKLSPAPPDPTQAKVMMLMPFVFTFLFLNFPAGLVLYWLVNSTLSVLQQWWITKRIAQST